MKRTRMRKLRKIVLKNIKYYRKKAGIDEQELSLKIGKKGNFIEKLENDKYKIEPTLMTIVLISKELNISIEDLIKERNKDN